MGGKDKESTVDGFAGEHVLFLLIADKKSTLVITSYWRGEPSNSILLTAKASHHHHRDQHHHHYYRNYHGKHNHEKHGEENRPTTYHWLFL